MPGSRLSHSLTRECADSNRLPPETCAKLAFLLATHLVFAGLGVKVPQVVVAHTLRKAGLASLHSHFACAYELESKLLTGIMWGSTIRIILGHTRSFVYSSYVSIIHATPCLNLWKT